VEVKGMPPLMAAIEATREISPAPAATTLSLLALFLPVGFMGGAAGRFMSSFGLTASFVIAVSLLIAFTLTPMLSARLMGNGEWGIGNRESGIGSRESGNRRCFPLPIPHSPFPTPHSPH